MSDKNNPSSYFTEKKLVMLKLNTVPFKLIDTNQFKLSIDVTLTKNNEHYLLSQETNFNYP